MKQTICINIVLVFSMLTLWGCGSGGNGTSNTYISKSTLAGTVSPSVNGIQITLVLPTGVTAQTDGSGQPLVTVLAPNNFTASNGSLIAIYTPASGATPGKVAITIIRASGFTAGDFFSVACEVAAGQAVPAASAFSYEGLTLFDSNGADITSSIGATASITL